MAVFAATDFTITLAGTAWSSKIKSISLPISVAELSTTAFGSTWETKIGGLKSFSSSITFNQDFAASDLDATIWPLLGTVIAFTVKPTSAATGTGNPIFSGSLLVASWDPVNATVGNLAEVSVTWPGTGAVTRATA